MLGFDICFLPCAPPFLNSMTFTTIALILHRTPQGERDQRVLLYSNEFGRIDAVARGALVRESKLASALEPPRLAAVQFARRAEHFKLLQVYTLEPLFPRRTPLNFLYQGAIIRYLRELIFRDVRNAQLFDLLLEALRILRDRAFTEEVGTRVARAVCARIRALEGRAPSLVRCVQCGGALRGIHDYFDAACGGKLCSVCAHHPMHRMCSKVIFTPDVATFVEHLTTSPLREMTRVYVRPPTAHAADRVLGEMIMHDLER